jgi:hypothetical protein
MWTELGPDLDALVHGVGDDALGHEGVATDHDISNVRAD